jgi:polar amino acid transport system substrate-binding protein
LKYAQLVRAPTSAAAIELFMEEGLDAAAGVRQPLLAFAQAVYVSSKAALPG